MLIASWNVAGLRACEKKGFYDWYLQNNPDIICLQEVKALPEQLSDQLRMPAGHDVCYAPADKKGYSGVATWVRTDIHCTHITGLGIPQFDIEGRTLITEFENFILFNCYFPNGQRDHKRVPYKLDYCRALAKKALQMHKDTCKEVIITGDFNTAHQAIDLANPKTNINTTGFLPIEREWMDEFQKQGFVDIFRQRHPGENGHYTWWTYRGDCRERNIGWRIDYFWSTQKIAAQAEDCFHQTSTLGSDHCPIFLKI